jgi:two-component system NtrC family sensor kinase
VRLDLVEAMAQLMPGLVHEFRNPLSGILGAGQMLARLLPADGAAREYVEMIREEAEQMERFLARLAEFGRLRPGQLQRLPGVDFAEVVAQALHECAPACRAQDVRVQRAFAADVPPLRGDAARLQRACAEILQNALEAMPRGGVLQVRVSVAADEAGGPGWLEAAFADTGSGLGPEAVRRAGEPFFSTRPRALGVGMCLAAFVLAGHGGSLAVVPGPDGGTEVRMRLPLHGGTSEA